MRCTSLWRTTSCPSKWTKAMSSMRSSTWGTMASPEVRLCGRSICVTSPVTTILEPNPRRVRNIFICSGEVFWASSRMMNESLSVRPRMNASGATSISPFSMRVASFSPLDHVVQGVEQRPEVRIDLLGHVPGRKPRLSPASTAGRVRMMRPTCLPKNALTAMAMARYVLPVPAGPMPKVIVLPRMASTYRFWLAVAGRSAGRGASRRRRRTPRGLARGLTAMSMSDSTMAASTGRPSRSP